MPVLRLVQRDDGTYEWVELPDGAVKLSNSGGNTDRDVRKFIRGMGGVANAENVARIGREVRRSEAENRRVEAEAKERGVDTRDAKGEVKPRVKKKVLDEIASRPEPPVRGISAAED